MYAAAVKKKKGEESRAAANALAQSKSGEKQGQGFVDNRPKSIDISRLRAKGNDKVAQTMQKKGKGKGLPESLKEGIENLSGYSMDDVNVHYNSPRPAQLQALAYTQGPDINIAPGQEKHLPHEAWHVVQQKQGRVKPTMQMKGVNPKDEVVLEHEENTNNNKSDFFGHNSPSANSNSIKEVRHRAGGARNVAILARYQYTIQRDVELKNILTGQKSTALPEQVITMIKNADKKEAFDIQREATLSRFLQETNKIYGQLQGNDIKRDFTSYELGDSNRQLENTSIRTEKDVEGFRDIFRSVLTQGLKSRGDMERTGVKFSSSSHDTKKKYAAQKSQLEEIIQEGEVYLKNTVKEAGTADTIEQTKRDTIKDMLEMVGTGAFSVALERGDHKYFGKIVPMVQTVRQVQKEKTPTSKQTGFNLGTGLSFGGGLKKKAESIKSNMPETNETETYLEQDFQKEVMEESIVTKSGRKDIENRLLNNFLILVNPKGKDMTKGENVVEEVATSEFNLVYVPEPYYKDAWSIMKEEELDTGILRNVKMGKISETGKTEDERITLHYIHANGYKFTEDYQIPRYDKALIKDMKNPEKEVIVSHIVKTPTEIERM